MKNIKRDYSVTDILLVEDNPGDSRLIEEAFRYSDRFIRLHVVQDGMEAMSFLRHEGNYRNSPRPNVILLDLNLPKMNGYEVLAQIKGDDNLKSIPTVILSCSRAEADIGKSYQLQANSYLSKPQEIEQFDWFTKKLCDYWLKEVKLPSPQDVLETTET